MKKLMTKHDLDMFVILGGKKYKVVDKGFEVSLKSPSCLSISTCCFAMNIAIEEVKHCNRRNRKVAL